MSMLSRQTVFSATITIRRARNFVFRATFSVRRRSLRSALPRMRLGTPFNTQNLRTAQSTYGDCARDDGCIANATVCDYRRVVFSSHRSDHTRYLLLFDSACLPANHPAGGIRRFAPREDHFATDGNRAAGPRTGGREQGVECSCPHLHRSFHRRTRQLTLVNVDPRSAVIDCTVEEDESSPRTTRSPDFGFVIVRS